MTKDYIFNIRKKDIISITGSGGKTSLMFYLSKKLKEKGKVLLTTSTKIKVPEKNEVDSIYTSIKDFKIEKHNEIIALGELIKEKNKLKAIDKKILLELSKNFTYTIIEADGSRNLPLKYWKDYEPVIYKESTKAIGVIPIKVLGKKPSVNFIYNFESYKKNIGMDVINEDSILKLIKSKPGIFGNFEGKKIIYINQVESRKEKQKAKKLLEYLKENTYGIDFSYGSILKEEFYEN